MRGCADPDEPRLVEHYLDLGQWLHRRNAQSQWDVALRTARLLINTAADPALPRHWRALCLDHIFQPIATLARLAHDEQRRHTLLTLRWTVARLDLDAADDAPQR